jgi:ribose transport system substrate-binding protein
VGICGIASAGLLFAGCTTDDVATDGATDTATEATDAAGGDSTDEWFDEQLFEAQSAQLTAEYEGDPDKLYLQYLAGSELVDTSEYATDSPVKVCFANASISNPWRVTGWITMNEQLKVLQDQGVISEMETRDAQDSDDQQIADIDYFIEEGNCDVFLISPNSTAAMTPAVERACETGKPVVVFDRGVQTDCMTTFVHPVGGFGFGVDSATFVADNLEAGDKVVALRILPGVDVLEQRWAAAERIFADAGIEATDYITEGDPARIKQVISDELARGDVQGVWMDAGDGGIAAIEAFEDAGKPLPVITGEDQIGFLKKWRDSGVVGHGPSYPTFQWRTALLAIESIANGEEIPAEWILPQPPVTAENLDEYLTTNEGMPDGHYALFGGEDLPGYPDVWIERQVP